MKKPNLAIMASTIMSLAPSFDDPSWAARLTPNASLKRSPHKSGRTRKQRQQRQHKKKQASASRRRNRS